VARGVLPVIAMRPLLALSFSCLALLACGASVDAGASAPVDAAQDGSPGGDAGACTACLGARLEWAFDGGLVAYRDRSAILPCNTYQRQRLSGTTKTLECTAAVGHCGGDAGGGAAPTIDAIVATLAEPEVQAAFASAPALFGLDPRPVDGQVLRITLGGAAVELGDACGGAAGCTEPPAALKTLATQLRALDTFEKAGSCAAFVR
jgi:hypothetical protein